MSDFKNLSCFNRVFTLFAESATLRYIAYKQAPLKPSRSSSFLFYLQCLPQQTDPRQSPFGATYLQTSTRLPNVSTLRQLRLCATFQTTTRLPSLSTPRLFPQYATLQAATMTRMTPTISPLLTSRLQIGFVHTPNAAHLSSVSTLIYRTSQA